MSNIDMLGTSYGQGMVITDRRWAPVDAIDAVPTADFAATQDIRTMDAYLTAANAAYWTATRLAQESIWDKLYYIRTTSQSGAGLS